MHRIVFAVLCLIGAVASSAARGDVDGGPGRTRESLTERATRIELGLGEPADPTRAMALFCRAGRAGDRAAIMHIAGWLLTAEGADYDPQLAAHWLRLAQTISRGVKPSRAVANPRCPTEVPERSVAANRQRVDRLVEQLAMLEGVDADLVKAMIVVESSYRIDAFSQAGAAGLLQLMPATAIQLGVADRFDIEQNLKGGISLMASLLARYRGNVALALAAYNAGSATVDKCGCVPNNGETLGYVERVRALYAAATP